MKLKTTLVCLVALALVAGAVGAQGNPTARVAGRVVAGDGSALPGVTVTLASPKLQGQRILTTSGDGQYSSPPMPPGEYEITFALDGFQTVQHVVRLSAGLILPLDASLPEATVTEEIVVTGEAVQTISETSTSASTMTSELLDSLPINRTLQAAVALAPGVSSTGPNDALTISGAQSWENLFTLNGVVINENLRGQAFDLFIEDAIQETTTQQSGVSAEYGRFTGGLVTAITKSGGNSFDGSFRTSFDNQDWEGSNEFTPEPEDKTNETFEVTAGGRLVRDRLWVFGAGRDREETDQGTTFLNIEYPTANEERRVEGKITAGLTTSHQLQGSYIEIEEDQSNVAHGGLTDFAATVDDGTIDEVRSLPQELKVVNYTGVLSPNFFVEAQASEREFFFEGGGGGDAAIDTGTPVWDIPLGIIVNESLFCDDTKVAGCIPEERSNEAARAKGSYFLSTDSGGSHDLAFGYETFTDIRASDNHQSPNDLMVWNFAESEIVGNNVNPLLLPGATTLQYLPILNPTQGTDFQTDSIFVNDRWRVNDKWSFNLGVRFDTNDAVNSLGNKVADSDSVSPRLGATYDIGANGRNVLHVALGRYSGAVSTGIFDESSSAGNPAQFGFVYAGAQSGFLDPVTFNQIAWGWLFDQCPSALDDPFSCPFLIQVDIPGATTVLDTGLNTTTAEEFSIGYQRELGKYGNVRIDYVGREFGDFFLTQRDQVTGVGSDSQGNQFDLGLVTNNDSDLDRNYHAVTVQTNLRFLNNRLRMGGNVQISNAYGNFNGETTGSGPVDSGFGEYPEYREARWNNPRGALAVDQRHRARLWGVYDIFRNDRNALSVSLLQSFFAGEPYSAIGDIDPSPFVNNPGYITPPSSGDPVDYFFSPRGAFTTDDWNRTDLAINYGINFGRFEIFIQPELVNAFDNDATTDVNTTVLTALDDPSLQPFNPFTDTPVEGTHFRFGDDFGQATEEDDLQDVREFRISVGFKINPL